MSVRVHLTDRAGGVSAAPYDSFNLALHVGDDPAAVAENRRRLAARLGIERVHFMAQVHGAGVAEADPAADTDVADTDVLLATSVGVHVGVLVADCVPIALTAPDVVAVAHAGRKGIAAGVVAEAVTAVRARTRQPVTATLGPAVCGRCYEVPEGLQREFTASFPVGRSRTRTDTPALDLPRTVRVELARLGVPVAPGESPCTLEDPSYFSHRRDGVTGRFALVAGLQ